MDIKEIQELVRIINKSNINKLVIEQKDFKILLKKTEDKETVQQVITGVPVTQQVIPQVAYSANQPAVTPQAPAAAAPEADTKAKEDKSEDANSKTIAIKSPMIGTFYRQAGPDKPVFASVGDVIEKGQVVCIIEAMKLFNEIESEVGGKIVKVLVEDASPVEFDQPLFLVEPNA